MNESPGSAEPQLRPANLTRITYPPTSELCREWYSRGYLPHRDRIGLLQSITFRLADSLPQENLRELKQERAQRVAGEAKLEGVERCGGFEGIEGEGAELGLRAPGVEERIKIEMWLDAGMGCCALRNPQVAQVVEDTLLKFDGEKYKLIAWCIMPNHVHVLIEPLIDLKRIVQSWKSYTGRWALAHNADLGLNIPSGQHAELGLRAPRFWMPDYWDRFIRNEAHLQAAIVYIHDNPVKAGLCVAPASWRWSSCDIVEALGARSPSCAHLSHSRNSGAGKRIRMHGSGAGAPRSQEHP